VEPFTRINVNKHLHAATCDLQNAPWTSFAAELVGEAESTGRAQAPEVLNVSSDTVSELRNCFSEANRGPK
jgi:hypothetical protein